MSSLIFYKPEILEIVLDTDIHEFFELVERSNKITLSEKLIELFKHNLIISFTLKNRDFLPLTSRTFSLKNHGWNWHNDSDHPVIGIYKPYGLNRIAGTLFTRVSKLPDFEFIPDELVTKDCLTRIDYNDKNSSKLVLFRNEQLQDGSFLYHKKETETDDIHTTIYDLGKTFSIHINNIYTTKSILASD